MIVNDRITDYIQSLETSQGPVLDEIEKEALDQFVPIIRKETAAFLRTMTAALKPWPYWRSARPSGILLCRCAG